MDNNQGEILKYLENICNKERLSENLSFAGIFIAYFERMQHSAYEHLVSFFMDYNTNIIDRPTRESASFREKVLSLAKYKFDAIFQWFANLGAITTDDLGIIKKSRNRRNKIAHNIDHFLLSGPSKEDVELLAELVRLYTALDQWWINVIEIPTSPDEVPEDYQTENVFSVESLVLQIIMDVAVNKSTFDYEEILESVKNSSNPK